MSKIEPRLFNSVLRLKKSNRNLSCKDRMSVFVILVYFVKTKLRPY